MTPILFRIVFSLVIGMMWTALLGCGGGSSMTVPATPVQQPPDVRPPDEVEPPGDTDSALSLPADHGLPFGRLTIQPGASDLYGNVVVSCPLGGNACVVNVGRTAPQPTPAAAAYPAS